jgi:hypothetical protein
MNKIFKHTILNCLSITAATHPKLVTFGIGLVVASVFVALAGNADTASAAYKIIGKAD